MTAQLAVARANARANRFDPLLRSYLGAECSKLAVTNLITEKAFNACDGAHSPMLIAYITHINGYVSTDSAVADMSYRSNRQTYVTLN